MLDTSAHERIEPGRAAVQGGHGGPQRRAGDGGGAGLGSEPANDVRGWPATSWEGIEGMGDRSLPFQFGDPLDPRTRDYQRRTSGARSPDVHRHFAADETNGGIEVEDRLHRVCQPVLVLAGKMDRTCVVEGAQAIATGIPGARLVVFERSGHMTFVEENEAYLEAVRGFLPPPPG